MERVRQIFDGTRRLALGYGRNCELIMPQLFDYEAQEDAETVIRAKEIEKDQGRMNRARQYVQGQKERFSNMETALPGKAPHLVNNAVRNSVFAKQNIKVKSRG